MKPRPWANIGGPIQAIIDDIRRLLEAHPDDPRVDIDVTSGVEKHVKFTGSKPWGFSHGGAFDASGLPLEIASFAFIDRPQDGAGRVKTDHYGVKVTFLSGTTGTVRGRLLGG